MSERAEPIVGVRTAAIAIHRARPGTETAIPFPEDEDYAIAAVTALRALPVEHRMEAMGMVRHYDVSTGNMTWAEPNG